MNSNRSHRYRIPKALSFFAASLVALPAAFVYAQSAGVPPVAPPPINVSGPASLETPYGGITATIPGTIEAEKYDVGGEGVSYHDSDTTNTLGAFRTDAVDIKTCVDTTGCGYALGSIAGGEWT